MIQPTSNYLGYQGTNALSENLSQKNPGPTSEQSSTDNVSSDQLSSSNTDALRTALSNSPEIRPDVVARGQALAADKMYPPLEIINRLAKMIISSDDPSEQS